MNSSTPFLPALRAQLAPMGARLGRACHILQTYTLGQLETHFGSCLPQTLFPKALAATAQAAEQRAAPSAWLQGRRGKGAAGSTLTSWPTTSFATPG